ncbi:MAG TPA: hypothetical protein VG815_07590 [Chloroflexota bacterium]|nr:hypothetical protein [Chloroflexota bacterium]
MFGTHGGTGNGGYFVAQKGAGVVGQGQYGVVGEGNIGLLVLGTQAGIQCDGFHRGGVFAGNDAQISLQPSKKAHPKSGQAGDLFLDKSKKLWLCVKGGTPATWKQVQVH